MLATLAAYGHGLPETTDVLFGDPLVALSTHGQLWEQETGWRWVCDEIFSGERSGAVRLDSGRVVIATTVGVHISDDGCTWTASSLTASVSALRLVDGRVWAVTFDAVYSSDDGEDFVEEQTGTFREMGVAGGRVFLFGYDTVWIDEVGYPLASQRLFVMAADDVRQALYVNAVDGDGGDHLVRIDGDGTTTTLFEPEGSLSNLGVGPGDALYATVLDVGRFRSTDRGATWDGPEGLALNCLITENDERWGCPHTGQLPAALVVAPLEEEPWDWQPVFSFSDVQPSCPDGTDVAAVCNPLWDAYAPLFDVADAVELETVAADEGCGCRTPISPWPLAAVLPFLVRRRPSRGL